MRSNPTLPRSSATQPVPFAPQPALERTQGGREASAPHHKLQRAQQEAAALRRGLARAIAASPLSTSTKAGASSADGLVASKAPEAEREVARLRGVLSKHEEAAGKLQTQVRGMRELLGSCAIGFFHVLSAGPLPCSNLDAHLAH